MLLAEKDEYRLIYDYSFMCSILYFARFFFTSLHDCYVIDPVLIKIIYLWWQHWGFHHIALSCWMLFTFGPQVCRTYGSFTFILLYVLGGLSGNFTSFYHMADPTVGGTVSIIHRISFHRDVLFAQFSLIFHTTHNPILWCRQFSHHNI